ncbi:hypothetical protein NC653_005256 [Populus alba x Populus x berolinensis]|nr:hypothetical protein NC653_005256 [Populus alba x Populus x berolinensis]
MSFEAINCLQKLVLDRLGLQFLAHLKEMSCNNEKWLNSSAKGRSDYNYEVVPANDDDKPTTSLKF